MAEAVREAEVAAILEARRAAMKEEEIRVVQQPIYLEVVSNYYALANTLWNMTLWVSKINENHLGVMNFSLEREAYTKNIHELVEKAKNEVDIPLSQELMIHAKLANTDWSIFTARYLTERANQDFKTIKLFGEDNEDHIAKIRAGLQDAQYKANIPGWQMTPDQYNDFLRLEKATRDTVTIYTKKMTEMENVISLLTKDLYENRLYILSSAI
ncbi:hypothetical protein EZS27_010912 [termite gut metagenome]|uniref:Uncharacterized protein n=1 Tax=termite gut metagenome TaxID=433724 RepID=A0A5J4S624_9ZZZZ